MLRGKPAPGLLRPDCRAGRDDVSFRGGVSGVERTVTYHRADPDRLLSVIRGFEEQCARLQGSRPRRFALATGGIR